MGITIFGLLISAIITGLLIGANLHYGDHPLMRQLDSDGPYVFIENDSLLQVNYIKGNKEDGFYTEQNTYPADSTITLTASFPLDSSAFDFSLQPKNETPECIYDDGHPVLAISDIESGYRTFRDFLINNQVIDKQLNWTFGRGHLVLVGDFVDRGNSTTQVLWFIYKLEQEAEKHGGKVHYILGNHELKNFRGQHEAASKKYYGVAAIMEKQHHQLYDSNSFIGKWLTTKNSIEMINGILFAHGGLHPDFGDQTISLKQINQINRQNYRKVFYPKRGDELEQLITSTRKGISWYRGYFKEDLTQQQVEAPLQRFSARSIVVGHTIQSRVNKQYQGKVFAIDVVHPKDYQKNWPKKRSEGLYIEDGKYYRVLHDGTKKQI